MIIDMGVLKAGNMVAMFAFSIRFLDRDLPRIMASLYDHFSYPAPELCYR